MQRACLAALILVALSTPSLAYVEGWFKGGSHPALYDAGVGVTPGMTGVRAAYIKPLEGASYSKTATIQQTISAENYRGKRVRFSARLKAENVERLQLWMSIALGGERASGRRSGGITGDAGWTPFETVLDIPASATEITFGLMLGGAKGIGWMDSLRFDVVGPEVPTSKGANGSQGWVNEGAWSNPDPFPSYWTADRGIVGGSPSQGGSRP